MSSEKNNLVRLATLKSPRDLSLGVGSGVTRGGIVRRKFVPNFNAAAAASKEKQKSEIQNLEVKVDKKENKRNSSSHKKDRSRERKNKNDLYIQKRSIFDFLPPSEAKQKKNSYSYSTKSLNSSSSSSSLIRSEKTKVKSENVMEIGSFDDAEEEEDDKDIIYKLINHSLIDDDEDMDSGDVSPLSLPFGGTIKKDFKLEADVKTDIKVEDTCMEVDGTGMDSSKVAFENGEDPPMKKISNECMSSFNFKKNEYYLVQLPNILPGTPPMTEEDLNNITNKKNEESFQKKQPRNLKDFSEGCIGSLIVKKGGRVQLLISEVVFNCCISLDVECRQELGMAACSNKKGVYDSLYRFGRTSKSLVVHPDLYEDRSLDLETDGNIMQKYNVYLCKPEDKMFYLFNLPLKYGLDQINSGRMKPICGKVQFDLDHWPTRDDENVKVVMTSSGSNILSKVFAIGVFNDDQFHVTPLTDILQMRPDFKSFNSKEEKEDDIKDEEKEDEGVQLVNARMKIKETESAKNKRLASYQHLQAEEQKEAWQEMRVIEPSDYFRECSLLSSSTQPCEFNMSWEDYVEAITSETKPCQDTETSLSSLNRLEIQEQIKWILERCKAIDFGQLTSLLPQNISHSEIIGYLEQYAVLIQGCWVIKSEHIISASNQTGVALRALRDFVLFKFSQGEGVTRAQLQSLHPSDKEAANVVLEGVSKQDRMLKQCVFALDHDKEFVKKYEHVHKRQSLLMKQKFEQIKIILPFKNTDTPSTKQAHQKKS